MTWSVFFFFFLQKASGWSETTILLGSVASFWYLSDENRCLSICAIAFQILRLINLSSSRLLSRTERRTICECFALGTWSGDVSGSLVRIYFRTPPTFSGASEIQNFVTCDCFLCFHSNQSELSASQNPFFLPSKFGNWECVGRASSWKGKSPSAKRKASFRDFLSEGRPLSPAPLAELSHSYLWL